MTEEYTAARASEAIQVVEALTKCPEPMDSENGNCILCGSGAVGGKDSSKLLMHEDDCPWKMARKAVQ